MVTLTRKFIAYLPKKLLIRWIISIRWIDEPTLEQGASPLLKHHENDRNAFPLTLALRELGLTYNISSITLVTMLRNNYDDYPDSHPLGRSFPKKLLLTRKRIYSWRSKRMRINCSSSGLVVYGNHWKFFKREQGLDFSGWSPSENGQLWYILLGNVSLLLNYIFLLQWFMTMNYLKCLFVALLRSSK